MLSFQQQGHLYISLPGQQQVDWISVSTLIGALTSPFDQEKMAAKCSKNTKSKWHKMTPEQIIDAWNTENERSKTLGTWYHAKKEQELSGQPNVYMPRIEQGIKIAPEQRLEHDGIYPEHLCYLQSAGVCGQSDEPMVEKGWLHIADHKSNKEIRTQGYYNYQTGTQKMLSPLAHLDDCEQVHYSLQLSLYAYIIHRHNPHLKVGTLTINHVQFEEEGKNIHGYPIHKLDTNNEPIVKSVTPIEVEYKKSEVITILNWLKTNRHKIH